jgi:hypothetical protein
LSSRRLFAPLALVALSALAACEIEKAAIPETEFQLALHGVLSPSAPSQVVLLERTRHGAVELFAPSFELYPMAGDEGIAERNASMMITAPDSTRYFAIEERASRADGLGEGIYRFQLPGSALERGRTYRLSVRAADGQLMEASATVPEGAPAMTAEAREFDRSHDTVVVEWPASPGARSYWVRIETPYGPRLFFTDSTRIRLTGELRNVDDEELNRVFIPGFQQALTVSAVDSNFYDWYRSANDVFSGSGLIDRVEGGLGVFGGLVRLRFTDFHVVAPQAEPFTGTFTLVGTPEELASAPFLGMELYLESRAARGDQADAVTGRIRVRGRFGYSGCLTCGVLGTRRGTQVKLSILQGWFASDTMDVFTGEIRGDTIVGSYRFQGTISKFVKQP